MPPSLPSPANPSPTPLPHAGDIDPWHALSVTRTETPARPAVLIRGGSHCADMAPARPADPPALVRARQVRPPPPPALTTPPHSPPRPNRGGWGDSWGGGGPKKGCDHTWKGAEPLGGPPPW